MRAFGVNADIYLSMTSRRGMLAGLATVAATVILVAGCSSEPAPRYTDAVAPAGNFDDLMRPAVSVTGFAGRPIANRSVGVMPGAPITVKSRNGRLTDVTVTGGDGGTIDGELSADGTTWVSNEAFGFGKNYTVVADARGVDGVSGSKVSFTTSSPSQLTDAYLVPNNGETVGVGQPVAIQFDEPISDKRAAQNAITVTTTPRVDGAFYWISDTEVRWRPQDWWKPGTRVHVNVKTKGIDLGDGTFGDNNIDSTFTIGRSMISYADDNTKMVTVTIDGKMVKTMPVSMGKDSSPTNTGTYIVAERDPSVIMDSSTYGVPVNSPGGYRETVYDATRMSYSGIYLHAAPWSLSDQGNTDVSNGCLNVSPANAKWFLDNSLRGDLVIVKNTVGPPLPGDDGLGDWNIPWSKWKAGNA